MKIRLYVTQKDINIYAKMSETGGSALTECAVARACKRNAVIGPIFNHVGIALLHLVGVPTIILPRTVQKNIYDITRSDRKVKPFQFTIEIPDNVL